ncbi:MFS transporter [Burkholderia sp. WSM2232]|uniref:MFS transporter n=1 Tax=Burkholderia sp. WSM2232 TaxID=944436 RepID=UPI000A02281B|nr:MFS transporter [Burkholderia sp. WSM2232]
MQRCSARWLTSCNYRDALRHRRFVLGVLANGCAFGGFTLYISCAANFVMHVLHQPDTAFGWLFVPLIAGVIAGSAPSARFAERLGNRATVRVGLSVTALAAVANLGYSVLHAATLPWTVMSLALYAFGMALAMPAMSSIAQANLPTMRGMAASLQNFVQMFIFALIASCAPPFVSTIRCEWPRASPSRPRAASRARARASRLV